MRSKNLMFKAGAWSLPPSSSLLFSKWKNLLWLDKLSRRQEPCIHSAKGPQRRRLTGAVEAGGGQRPWVWSAGRHGGERQAIEREATGAGDGPPGAVVIHKGPENAANAEGWPRVRDRAGPG